MNLRSRQYSLVLGAAVLTNTAMAQNHPPSIPIIDISCLVSKTPENNRETIQQISEALLEYGFFYVVNHGIEESLQKAVFDNIKKFFDLPQENKNEIHKVDGGYRGYFGMKEEVSTETKASDWKEGIYYFLDFEMANDRPENIFSGTNPWPVQKYVPEFQPKIQEYFEKGMSLGSILMGAIAVGLGLENDFFSSKFNEDPFAQLGMFHYPPYPHDNQDTWAAQAHTDYGFITILMQDDVGGLQVKLKDGSWIDAPTIPNSFVINIGDALEIWTSGAYSARLHRVRTSKTHHRYSVPLFYDPSLDCVIDRIPMENTIIPLQCANTNFNIKFPFTYGDYILNKYQTIIPKEK